MKELLENTNLIDDPILAVDIFMVNFVIFHNCDALRDYENDSNRLNSYIFVMYGKLRFTPFAECITMRGSTYVFD